MPVKALREDAPPWARLRARKGTLFSLQYDTYALSIDIENQGGEKRRTIVETSASSPGWMTSWMCGVATVFQGSVAFTYRASSTPKMTDFGERMLLSSRWISAALNCWCCRGKRSGLSAAELATACGPTRARL